MSALSFSASLDLLLRRTRALHAEHAPPVAADDPTRSPNWCWAHNAMWPACADRH
jgi:hypothetical protein